MDTIGINVTGEREVGLRFDEFPDVLRNELKAKIGSLGAELLVRVEAATPSRTGKLRSQERVRVYDDPNQIRAVVGIGSDDGNDYAKAGTLEWGAPGHRSRPDVKSHKMKLDHVWGHKLTEPIDVIVKAYHRTAHIEEFMFERGPLASMAPEILEELNSVVEAAVAKTNR